MIKCKEGHVEFHGFPWTVYADMAIIVKGYISNFGEDEFERVLKSAMTIEEDMIKTSKETKLSEEDKKMLDICNILERMAMEDD